MQIKLIVNRRQAAIERTRGWWIFKKKEYLAVSDGSYWYSISHKASDHVWTDRTTADKYFERLIAE